MESKNYKIIRSFITDNEVILILEWLKTLNHSGSDGNFHLKEISKSLNGKSYIFDVSKTDKTKFITKFQSVTDVSTDTPPDFIFDIINRISEEINLPTDNIFFQIVDMNKGGKIVPHYDAGLDGVINYKCNISVLSEDYDFYIDKESINIKEKDMYCFEASLYKHWTNEFNSRRIFLSFGFLVPYSTTNRTDTDPRVRLSKRIYKYFMK